MGYFFDAVVCYGDIRDYFYVVFENYWEGAIIAFIADAFYSLPGAKFFAGGFGFFTLSSLFILYLSSFIKNKIRILK